VKGGGGGGYGRSFHIHRSIHSVTKFFILFIQQKYCISIDSLDLKVIKNNSNKGSDN